MSLWILFFLRPCGIAYCYLTKKRESKSSLRPCEIQFVQNNKKERFALFFIILHFIHIMPVIGNWELERRTKMATRKLRGFRLKRTASAGRIIDRKDEWIIVICNSDVDGAVIQRVYGDKKKVRKVLVRMVLEDKNRDPDNYISGTESENEVEDMDKDKKLYAFGVYSLYNIDYTAQKTKEILVSPLSGSTGKSTTHRLGADPP